MWYFLPTDPAGAVGQGCAAAVPRARGGQAGGTDIHWAVHPGYGG